MKPSPLLKTYRKSLSAPLPDAAKLPAPAGLPKDGPVVMIFSPHPDDEVLIGGWPLRLRREKHARVVNVAVTFGTNPDRREERREELAKACAVVDFECIELGWTGVTLAGKRENAARWDGWVGEVAAILRRTAPDYLFYPHAHDGHVAHVGTHHLVREALARCETLHPWAVETEWWHPIRHPNVMVESSLEDVDLLIAALAEHRGEVARNPYHRRLPAWMLDNTRRGAELIAGAGAAAPDFLFSTLYRVRGSGWRGDRFFPADKPL